MGRALAFSLKFFVTIEYSLLPTAFVRAETDKSIYQGHNNGTISQLPKKNFSCLFYAPWEIGVVWSQGDPAAAPMCSVSEAFSEVSLVPEAKACRHMFYPIAENSSVSLRSHRDATPRSPPFSAPFQCNVKVHLPWLDLPHLSCHTTTPLLHPCSSTMSLSCDICIVQIGNSDHASVPVF